MLAASLFATLFMVPRASPFHALAFLLSNADGASACLACAGEHLGAAIALAGCALGAVSAARRRAKRRAGGRA
jgi:hypothetical protein